MTVTKVVTSRQLWDALRESVPELPVTTRKAILHVFRDHAWLEWEETRQEVQGSQDVYSLMQIHKWPTLGEVVGLWHTLEEKIGALPAGMQEARIEMRDLDIQAAVKIEGYLLWMILG